MELINLPNEVLDLIIDAAGSDDYKRDLGILRFVCKRFSRLESLLGRLFHNVQLIADAQDFASLTPEALAASGIASHVRHITFVPPLRYPMSLPDFKHILKDQAYHRYGCYSPNLKPRRYSGPTFGTSRTYGNLHTAEQLEAGFEKYIAWARLACDFVSSGTMHSQWSRVIAQMTCRSFRFALIDYNMIGLDLQPMRPKCVIPSGRHSRQDVRIHCDERKAQAIADGFSAVVLKVLRELDIAIEALECNQISMYTRTRFHEALRAEDGPDLTQLRHLRLEPYPYHTDYTLIRSKDILGHEDIASPFFNSLNTIETYQIHSRWPLSWVDAPVPLPSLRVLDFELVHFKASGLAEWLPLLPKLEYISLRSMNLEIDGDEDGDPIACLKRMFDAFRDHAMLRSGDLGIRDALEDVEHHIRFDKDGVIETDDDVADMQAMLEEVSLSNVDAWLSLYICGRVEWNGNLKALWGHEIDDWE